MNEININLVFHHVNRFVFINEKLVYKRFIFFFHNWCLYRLAEFTGICTHEVKNINNYK